MAISWAQGLLAGAAGVAEYSNQEQARRQKRMDRTHELQNQMKEISAKSKYAARYKEYEDNRKTLKSLEGIDPQSPAGQLALYTSKGYSEESALVLMKQGNKLTLPKSMKEPQLTMPEYTQGKATSPLQDWVRNYKGTIKERVTPQETTEPSMAAQVAPEAVAAEMTTPVTTDSTEPKAINETESSIGSNARTVQDQEFYDAMGPKKEYNPAHWVTKTIEGKTYKMPVFQEKGGKGVVHGDLIEMDSKGIKYERTTQSTTQNGVSGQLVTFTNPHDPKDTFTRFESSGQSAYKPIANKETKMPDGTTVVTERYQDPTTLEIRVGDTWTSVVGSKGWTPVKLQEFPEYMDDTKGRFNTDFPLEEQEAWAKWLDVDAEGAAANFDAAISMNWFDGNDLPKDFKARMGAAMLDNMNISRAKAGPGINSNPNRANDIKALAKATTYIQILSEETVIEMLQAEALPKELFFGSVMNKSKAIRRIQEAIGYDDVNSPEYKKLSNRDTMTLGGGWKDFGSLGDSDGY